MSGTSIRSTWVRMFQRGHLERRATGVYRLRLTPASSLDAYMEAVLWPGPGVRGVLSHETALDLYGLSDVNPARIDVTLPRAHRIRRAVPAVYRIHHPDLADEDVTTFEGVPIVTPARAIRQAAAAHLGPALIGQAIDHAERDGRLTRRTAEELLDVERGRGSTALSGQYRPPVQRSHLERLVDSYGRAHGLAVQRTRRWVLVMAYRPRV